MATNDDLLLKEFLIESYDCLNSIKSLLNDIEKNPKNTEALNDLFRGIHTLKGSSSFLGLVKLKNLAHSVESLLDNLRQFKLIFNQDIYDILIESFDYIQLILKSIEDGKSDEGIDIDLIVLKLDLVLELPPAPSQPETNSAPEVNVAVATAPESEKIETPSISNSMEKKLEEAMDIHSSEANGSARVASISDSVVKVNVKLLDQIMNMIGELVVNRNQILQYAGRTEDFDLQKLTHQLDIITSELQNEFMSTRMQPVGQVLSKFERIVRDLSKSQGKKVQLIISGQETELDKTLIEAIKDPLTHLIRNALDHGIENPQDRAKASKNEIATLKIMALHENGKVSIKIQDDGRGIDHEKIKTIAISKGVISKETAEKMGEKELVNLIFAPGFSTAEKITDISGRGVGMDVVKTNIEKIGGEIDIQTIKGLGTTIVLKIPLTLAIIPSLTVEANKKSYCIPQLNIVEFVLLDIVLNKTSLHQMHGVNFFKLREKLIPIYSLSSILEKGTTKEIAELNNSELLSIVVVNGDGQEYGLVVDTIFDIEEIVVKPLSRNLKNLEYYSGATIMGNGEIALILDTASVIRKINPNRIKNESKSVSAGNISNTRNDGTRDFLIFSLRDNKKYGISLSFIDRIEEIATKDLNFSSNRIFIKYRDQVMPIIDVQNSIDPNMQLTFTLDTVQILVINVQGHLVGLLVNNVYDTLSIMEEIDEFANNHPALSGTVFVNESAVLVLNLTNILNTINIQIKGKENKKIIYHVDDSKMHRSILRDILDSEFTDVFEVKSFSDPSEFLNFLKKASDTVALGSVLITDIDMPNMNGWDLVSEIKKNYASLNFLIATLTSRDHMDDKEKSKELGISFHLKKFNKIDIVSSINNLLGWDNIYSAEALLAQNAVEITTDQFCGFKIGNESYAIPIANVQEVVKAQFISTVPKSATEVNGLINLRGQIVTSICLGSVFDKEHHQNEEHMNIIVRNNEGLASLMVDEILDVMDFEISERTHVPENVSADLRKYFDGVCKRADDLVTIVNVNSLLEDVL